MKLALAILVCVFYSCNCFTQQVVTEVGGIRFGKPYSTIYKNLYSMAKSEDFKPIRINDSIIYSKLEFGNIIFNGIYLFNESLTLKYKFLKEIQIRNSYNKSNFTAALELLNTKFGRESKIIVEKSDSVFVWNLKNIDIKAGVEPDKNEYILRFILK